MVSGTLRHIQQSAVIIRSGVNLGWNAGGDKFLRKETKWSAWLKSQTPVRRDKMTQPKFKLSELIEGVDFDSAENQTYLDLETGEILYISGDDRYVFDGGKEELESAPEWQRPHLESIWEILEKEDDLDPNRYLTLVDKFDFHEYRQMEKFIMALSSERLRDELDYAIRGKGAFRRFKDVLARHDLLDQWYAYKDAALKQFVVEWCEEEEIPFIDDTHPRKSNKPKNA